MISKVRLLFDTIRHLKPVQIFHQFYYRLKPIKNLSYYSSKQNQCAVFKELYFDHCITVFKVVTEDRIFNFLNKSHEFQNSIDWDFQGYGKLWNYNLQYFGFLHQEDISEELKKKWILDINEWLLNGTLKLEPYPVSLRVINIIRYCSKNDITNREIISSIFSQVTYLFKNIEYHLLGNHLLENAFALLMSGYVFNNSKWEEKAKSILYKELDEQILDDGGHFELSPMYHQIILFRMLELIDWFSKVQNPDIQFLSFIRNKTSLMLGWLKTITFKNGDIPHFNDSTSGIACDSNELFRYAEKLNLDAIVLNHLRSSGYRKFLSEHYECVVDVGPIGASYQPGHSHADALSFILYYKAKPFIIDSGTSTYQIGERRNYERSTASHNTVVVEDINQSQVWGGFRVGKRAQIISIDKEENQLSAEHNGYLHNFGVIHKRSFTFLHNEIHIEDNIGNTNGKAFFHFHSDCLVSSNQDNTIIIKGVGMIKFENINSFFIREYKLAIGFNKYEIALELVVGFKAHVKTIILFND